MTRRLRPPVPLLITCNPEGRPRTVYHAGHMRQVTHIAAIWEQPPRWWRAPAGKGLQPTQHYRLVLDWRLLIETHCEDGRWLLDKILD